MVIIVACNLVVIGMLVKPRSMLDNTIMDTDEGARRSFAVPNAVVICTYVKRIVQLGEIYNKTTVMLHTQWLL